MQVLLESDFDRYSRDNDGNTPLYPAAEEGHLHVIKVPTKAGAGDIPLRIAAEDSNEEICKAPVDAKVKADVCNGDSPLSTAAGRHSSIAEFLNENGADVN